MPARDICEPQVIRALEKEGWQVDTLSEILKNEVSWYAGSGHGAKMRLFRILDDTNQTYAVIAVDVPKHDEPAGVLVLARVVGDKIIIEEDSTDKPLYKSLMHAGIPLD